jgi:hypothetical protein
MKFHRTVLAAFTLSLVCSVAAAGPRVLEQRARVALPDSSYTLFDVAVDGDSIIALASRPFRDPARPFVVGERVGLLFQRNSAGNWQYVRQLFRVETDLTQPVQPISIAMQGGVAAAIYLGQLQVFERTSAGWSSASAVGSGDGVDVKVHSGMIVASSGACGYDANLHQKDASGVWRIVHTFRGQAKPGCDAQSRGALVDIADNRVLVTAPGELHIWHRNADGSWPTFATGIAPMLDAAGNPLVAAAIEGDTVVRGDQVYRNNGGWGFAGLVRRPDIAMVGDGSGLEMLDGLASIGYPRDPDRGSNAGSLGVFRRDAAGNFSYAARLVASDATDEALLGAAVEMSGRRVVTTGDNAVYVFDLPASLSQPATIQDDFEDGNALEWTPLAGSNFSVVSSGGSRVYRQSSTAGDAAATRSGMDWTNQGIEAVVTPRAFAGTGEQWFGLTVRQRDPGNYYYLTMRSTNRAELRSLRNGAINVLYSTEVPVSLNRPYRLRLEAVGTWIRVYVDGELRAQVQDTVHTRGTAGIRTYKAAADFDSVVISANPQTTLLVDRFDGPDPDVWTAQQGQWTKSPEGAQVFTQTSLAGDGRVTTYEPARDQAVQARARANTYASGGGDRWFGLLARYQDDRNFYYVTVRNTNTVSLRKLVNGTIFILDTASLPVSTGRWYSLRLEAVGNLLRVYVDNRLLLEAPDSSHPKGTYGLATYRTIADFDDVVVTQP